jgi:Tfp pilus assembly protein PilX
MKRNQQGLTLFVAMIILVMVTLLVVSAFRTSNTNLKIVSSMQGRQEALASAQAAIEQILSSSFFAENPTIVAATNLFVDVNTDGTPDYEVDIAVPQCLSTAPIVVGNPPTQLQIDCAGSARFPSTTPNWCANVVWQLEATTTDRLTGAKNTVRQGVGMTVEITNAKSACR